MAQPQGLNVPSILTTGIVGVILTMAVIEGVRAYYYRLLASEEAHSWTNTMPREKDHLRREQLKAIRFDSDVKIDEAMKLIADNNGKLPKGTIK